MARPENRLDIEWDYCFITYLYYDCDDIPYTGNRGYICRLDRERLLALHECEAFHIYAPTYDEAYDRVLEMRATPEYRNIIEILSCHGAEQSPPDLENVELMPIVWRDIGCRLGHRA